MVDLKRIHALEQKLKDIPADALIIDDVKNIFYLTGRELSSGKLLVAPDKSVLIVDGRYYESCKNTSPCPVYHNDQLFLKDWTLHHSIKKLAFESDKTNFQAYEQLKKTLSENGNHIELIPVSSPVLAMRMIKDEEEIEILKEAAKLGYKGYEHILSQLKEGVKESDVAVELEYFWRKKGAKRVAFDPIIAFGSNSSMPHYRAGETELKNDTEVLIDIGVEWQHYHSDMTRVLFFGHHPCDHIKEIYDVVAEAKRLALEQCKPGTLIGDLDKVARDYIASKGYGPNFSHSLGHGIGLEVHEPPTIRQNGPYSNMPLQPGMVITIEPGIYIPKIGGVRLEDTVLITEEGYLNLTE